MGENECRNGEAGIYEEAVEDGCNSLLMPVCGSVLEVGEPLGVEWGILGTFS